MSDKLRLSGDVCVKAFLPPSPSPPLFISAVKGMVTLASLMAKVMNGAVNVDDPVSKVLFEQFVMVR